MLVSLSQQGSVNSRNIVICNLSSSLVLLRRDSVNQMLFLPILMKATVSPGTETRLCSTGLF